MSSNEKSVYREQDSKSKSLFSQRRLKVMIVNIKIFERNDERRRDGYRQGVLTTNELTTYKVSFKIVQFLA